MAFTDTERLFVDLLKEAGDKLVHPPSNVGEILSLLDLVECCLMWISEPPSKSFENALRPLTNALLAEDLMRHSDNDVKVSLASCISERTRISVPAIPYDDEQLKRAFRLIVDALDGLSDTSSRSYSKRVSILESMVKVPSYVVLLDYRYHDMILEMFQHFLKSIRDYHPDHVFSAMETIMTLVLTKSDDESVGLRFLLLDSLRNHKFILPIGRKLARKVIRNFLAKYAHQKKVFDAECNGANANASDEHPINESKSLENAGADRIPQEVNKVSLKANGSGLLDLAPGNSSQSVVTNDDSQTGDSLTRPSSPQKKPRCTDHNTDEAKTTDTAENIEPDNLEPKMVGKPEMAGSGLVDLALDRSFKSVVTNDDSQTGNGDSLTRPSSPQKKPRCTDHNTDEAKTTDTAEKIEPDNLESKMVVKPEMAGSGLVDLAREVQNLLERSFDNSDNRDAALEWVEAENRFTLIEPCERREKTIATDKADKNLHTFESWENSKKAALETKLKKFEDQMGRKKAVYVEEMKNEVETAGEYRVSESGKRAMRFIILIFVPMACGGYLLFFVFVLMMLWKVAMGFYSNL